MTDAKLITVSADPAIVAEIADSLMRARTGADKENDPILASLERGKRSVLRLIKQEALANKPTISGAGVLLSLQRGKPNDGNMK